MRGEDELKTMISAVDTHFARERTHVWEADCANGAV